MKHTRTHTYHTRGGIQVHRAGISVDYPNATEELITALDVSPGVLFSSGVEFPGRYTRWDIGFVNPPLRLSSSGRRLSIKALNGRGELLLQPCRALLQDNADVSEIDDSARCLQFTMRAAEPVVVEEERTRQRSVFTFLRSLLQCFSSPEDEHLGLYGAFGYELAFQFEAVCLGQNRSPGSRDMVLYLPDSILVVDHKRETAQQLVYDFSLPMFPDSRGTRNLPRTVPTNPFRLPPVDTPSLHCDHAPGVYADTVTLAREYFARGDLFEVVPGQSFFSPCQDSPAQIFRRLQQQNPAPYGALLNLGEQEYLVAASPEMYVRVDGRRVETCPISGTIARGVDALEDAEQIRTLLNSAKDEAELSMCTDVDRNDKSRVCVPGSVRVLGRRQLELYSRLIHTVDHVEGTLKPQFDALDAFLSHAWAVTVTGAPKQAAIQFLEEHEHSPRGWYGGALGCLNFNGNLNTGLTIRTMRIQDGIAEVRAGATLLFDSEPEAEEAETRLKASALLGALQVPDRQQNSKEGPGAATCQPQVGKGIRVLMVDHQDSFVHTLAACFAMHGAEVTTVRFEAVVTMLERMQPQLVVLSPGPGRPQDFALSRTVELCLAQGVAVFGVCLGLQGIVEHFGGTLAQLEYPVHGKPSLLQDVQGGLFAGLELPLQVGRYHSLIAHGVPDCLEVCARSADGHVMAVQHRLLPVAAVQFHPESILSMAGGKGNRLIANVLRTLVVGNSEPEDQSEEEPQRVSIG